MSATPPAHDGLWLSCRRATELASRALDVPLTARERWALRLHLALCVFCRRYRRQIDLLHKAWSRAPAPGSGPGLPDDARARIRRSLPAGR